KIEDNIKNSGHLIEDKGRIYLKYLYLYEQEIAQKINDLMQKSKLTEVRDVNKTIKQIESQNNITYTGQQKKAIKNTFVNPISIITGGPGTGKTTIVKAVIAIAEKNGF